MIRSQARSALSVRVHEMILDLIEHPAKEPSELDEWISQAFPDTEPAILELACERSVSALKRRINESTRKIDVIQQWLRDPNGGEIPW